MTSPSVYDHLSPTTDDYPDGIYRVVGTGEEGSTLLRVGNADGQRVNTGEVATINNDALDGFTPAENPDGNWPFGTAILSMLQISYWSVRVFIQQLVAHPLLTASALIVTGATYFGEEYVPFPNTTATIVIVMGGLALTYIGSGGLSE